MWVSEYPQNKNQGLNDQDMIFNQGPDGASEYSVKGWLKSE